MRTNKMKVLLAAILFALVFQTSVMVGLAQEPSVVPAQELRCEYLENPLGIDVREPRLSWALNPEAGVLGQSAYRILVASSPENLDRDQGDLWDSGRVESAQTTWVEYGGSALESGQQAYWKVRVWNSAREQMPWSREASWSMGLLEASDWHADWIGEALPAGTEEGTPLPFPWLRKTFTLDEAPERAVAYVNPLGYYELYINGQKVDDQVLSPAVSDYSKRNLYVTHEIADYLVPGENVVALWLGRGWYVRGHAGVTHDGPLVRAQLDISMSDGSTSQVVTDGTWKLRESPLSPVGRGTAFGDYGGEHYDPARELPEWNSVDLDDSSWQPATVFPSPEGAITAAQMVQPNRIVETLPAMKVEPYPEGGWIIDLGKNITGWLEVDLPPIPEGEVATLYYSDRMTPDPPVPASVFGPAEEGRGGRGGRGGGPSLPSTYNQRDEIAGDGEAFTFRSRFNYHGFRYVLVTGIEEAPAVGGARGFLIRTDYDRAGEFRSSNHLLNEIHAMMTRTYEALTLGGYVVDCPTRERLGYGGDAGTSFETGMYNFSTGGLYNRWLSNWRDSQVASGSLPHTAPNYQEQGGGGPMWGGITITLPWQMYLQYGDTGVLETNYEMMRKWLDYLDAETEGGLLLNHVSHAMERQTWNFLGDWVSPKGNVRGDSPDPSPAQLINSVHYVYQLQLAAKIAGILGNQADAATFSSRANASAAAINARFYNPDTASYNNGDTVAEAFPLLTGIVPPALREDVMETLVNTILVRNEGHMDTGMHGTYFVMKYLIDAGRDDLLYEMVNRVDYPSWGYMLANGATTSWESWRGATHIHDTLISIGAWFYQGLAGIRSDGESPGFRHFLIDPAPVGDLTSVQGSYNSIHGEIVSDWRIEDGTFKLDVTVPPGTTATVTVPGEGPIRSRVPSSGERNFEVSPGNYHFETTM